MHGGPGTGHLFMAPLMKSITDRQVIMYDQFGCGRSTIGDKAQWNVKNLVKEFEYLADSLSLDKFHLMGASWGTTLALEYYLRTKDKRVSSLIFQSPMFSAKLWENDGKRLIRGLPEKHQKAIFHCQKVGAYDAKVYQDAEAAYAKKHILRKDVKEEYAKAFKFFNFDIYNHMWGPTEFCPTGSLKKYDRTKDLSKIKVPSFIFCGQYDESTPETNLKFSKKIPDCEFKVMKGLSHCASMEDLKKYTKTLQSFLKKQP